MGDSSRVLHGEMGRAGNESVDISSTDFAVRSPEHLLGQSAGRSRSTYPRHELLRP